MSDDEIDFSDDAELRDFAGSTVSTATEKSPRRKRKHSFSSDERGGLSSSEEPPERPRRYTLARERDERNRREQEHEGLVGNGNIHHRPTAVSSSSPRPNDFYVDQNVDSDHSRIEYHELSTDATEPRLTDWETVDDNVNAVLNSQHQNMDDKNPARPSAAAAAPTFTAYVGGDVGRRLDEEFTGAAVPATKNDEDPAPVSLNAFKQYRGSAPNAAVVKRAAAALGVGVDWEWSKFKDKLAHVHSAGRRVPPDVCRHLFDIAALRKNSCQYGLFLFGLVLGRPISMEEDFRRFFVPHHRVFRTFDAKASLLGWNPTLSIFLQTFGRLGVPVDFVRLAPRPTADWTATVETALFETTAAKPTARPLDGEWNENFEKIIRKHRPTSPPSSSPRPTPPPAEKPPILNLEFTLGFLAACVEVGLVDTSTAEGEGEKAAGDPTPPPLTEMEQVLTIAVLLLCDEHSGGVEIAMRATELLWEKASEKNRRRAESKLKEVLCHKKLMGLPSMLNRLPVPAKEKGAAPWDGLKRNLAMESLRSWWSRWAAKSAVAPAFLESDEVASVESLQQMVAGLADAIPRVARRFLYMCNLFDVVVDFVAWSWLSKHKADVGSFLKTVEDFEEFLTRQRQNLDPDLCKLKFSASFCKSKFGCLATA